MVFRFDRYTLNSETRTLSCGDSTVTLTPKVFQTLLVLVENHTRVMSKDELVEHIWPHQTVEEANLTQNISILRKALEEATYGKRYIATFHGHGYRFVEPVEVENAHYGHAARAAPSEPEMDRLERAAAPAAPEISLSEEPLQTVSALPKSRRRSLLVSEKPGAGTKFGGTITNTPATPVNAAVSASTNIVGVLPVELWGRLR